MRTCQGLRSAITFFCRVYASVALPGVLFNGTDQTLAATLQSPLWASTRRRMSAFGGKADMTVCGNPLLRSLLGVKRTSYFGSKRLALE
jgi:hypothetical protein